MSLDIKVMPLGPISANCYILTDKKSRESAVIDPGDFNEALKNAVKDLNIKYILLTHGHFDHRSGGYSRAGRKHGVPLQRDSENRVERFEKF